MRRIFVALLLALVLIASGSLANAAPLAQQTAPPPRKLSGTMPAFGNVLGTIRISPNGLFAVYRADQETDGTFDLWSVRLDGSQPPVKLNGLLPTGKFVREDFAITPFGRVIYAAEQDVAGRDDLYSVPINGGTPVRLSNPGIIGGESGTFLITPNGDTIVFTAVGLTGRTQIYAVSATGGAITTLTAPPVLGGFPSRLVLTPDGSRLIFYGDIEVNSRFELFTVPVLGGATTKLNATLATGGLVLGFTLSPDGSRVVYVAGQDTADQWDVYSVAAAGGTPVQLNPAFPGHTDAGVTVWISPDSVYALYTADVNADEAFELYSVPITGGAAVKLNGALVADGDVDLDNPPLFSTDSGSVVYRADQQTNDVYELYAVPITGGPVVKVNDPMAGSGVNAARLSPNGNVFVFGGQPVGASHERLWSKPMGTGGLVDLFPALADDDSIDSFCSVYSPDGRWLAFSVHDLATQQGLAYVVPVNGGAPTPVGGPFTTGGGVMQCSLAWYPNGAGLVYVADQDTDDVFELYTVSLKDIVATPTPTATATAPANGTPTPPTPPAGAYTLYFPAIQQGEPLTP